MNQKNFFAPTHQSKAHWNDIFYPINAIRKIMCDDEMNKMKKKVIYHRIIYNHVAGVMLAFFFDKFLSLSFVRFHFIIDIYLILL